jgi:hypothetical protein
VIVDGEPGVRDVWLAEDKRAVVGVEEARAIRESLRNPVIFDDRGESVALGKAAARCDGELVAVPAPVGRRTVDRNRPDGKPLEVPALRKPVSERPGSTTTMIRGST